MEIDCPLFRCLSHWVMKWRRGQPLGQFLLSSSCPTGHFASHRLSTDIDWDKYLYKFRCRAVYPYSINYWRFIVRVEHSLGRSLSLYPLAPPPPTSVLCLVYIVLYIPVYIQIYSVHTNSFVLEAVWRAHVCIIMGQVNAMAVPSALAIPSPFSFPLPCPFSLPPVSFHSTSPALHVDICE